MSLLTPAVNRAAYLKAGLLGFGGSGKTTTAALIAIALSKLYGKHKAVAMLDTETGSDFLIPLFEAHGIKFYVHKSRSLADLLQMYKESKDQVDVHLTDSISAVWKEVMTAYKHKKKKNRLTFNDWGPIKEEWQGFSDAYVNAPFHSIICGRAGFEYEMDEDDEGNKELVKTGVKMKAESEIGFEPSLLIEMQRVGKAASVTTDPTTHGWLHRAIVLKDRSHQMNGVVRDFGTRPGEALSFDPILKFIAPHLSYLNIGGEHVGVDTSRNSESLFEGTGASRSDRARQVAITLDLIKDSFIEAGKDGQTREDKAARVQLLKQSFGTSSWTAIENMRLEDLEDGHRTLRLNIGLTKPDPVEALGPLDTIPDEDEAPVNA